MGRKIIATLLVLGFLCAPMLVIAKDTLPKIADIKECTIKKGVFKIIVRCDRYLSDGDKIYQLIIMKRVDGKRHGQKYVVWFDKDLRLRQAGMTAWVEMDNGETYSSGMNLSSAKADTIFGICEMFLDGVKWK